VRCVGLDERSLALLRSPLRPARLPQARLPHPGLEHGPYVRGRAPLPLLQAPEDRLVSSRGTQRENLVKDWLEENGWWVCRAAGSLGDADLAAMIAPWTPRHDPLGFRTVSDKLLIEVKSTARSPFADFGPVDRAELLAAGQKAGADVVLCWCPPGRKAPEKWGWYWPESWPKLKAAA
jgi:hypothetical protein